MMSDYKNYAVALFELAVEDNSLDAVFEEVNIVSDILKQNPEYIKIVSSTLLPKNKKLELAESAFSTLSELCRNFICFLISKNIFSAFNKCAETFTELYYKEKGILTATVTSAKELSEEDKKKLCDILGEKEGKKVMLTAKVDPSLIGGALLCFDGKEIDSSLKSRLESLKAKLIEI